MRVVRERLERIQILDSHVHLIGVADSNSGTWFNRAMNSPWHLFSASDRVNRKLLSANAVSFLHEIRMHNPLLFDFVLKRLLRFNQFQFPSSVFETCRFFQKKSV
ncbi:MAG: hypothetical protein ACYC3O_08255 [Burkholderiales bacterium]